MDPNDLREKGRGQHEYDRDRNDALCRPIGHAPCLAEHPNERPTDRVCHQKTVADHDQENVQRGQSGTGVNQGHVKSQQNPAYADVSDTG